jgi:hypothetical protein
MAEQELFKIDILKLQPSQLYINEEKLYEIKRTINEEGIDSLEPVPVKKLDGKLMLTDGHTRALALLQIGINEILAEWETEELGWDEYRDCVRWCDDEGIVTVADLEKRIIDDVKYQILWLKRCADNRKDKGYE